LTHTNEEDAQIASLGLTADAPSEEVASARASIDDFLSTAPADLRAWADLQSRRVHRALDAFEDDPLAKPSVNDEKHAQPAKTRRPNRRVASLLVALAVVGVLIGVYFSGGTGGQMNAAPQASGQMPAISVDEQEVEKLMAELAKSPNDIEIMRKLGKVYYAGGDMVMAGQWQSRILEISPDDVDALLALGVAKLNIGDLTSAEENWTRVVELKPDMPEVYYNLGFLYFSKEPPDTEKAKEAWAKVVELAPNSDMASTIESHLAGGLGATAPNPEKTP
jgi:cytochrome c-type biogenesis protein CcmH/NrfG